MRRCWWSGARESIYIGLVLGGGCGWLANGRRSRGSWTWAVGCDGTDGGGCASGISVDPEAAGRRAEFSVWEEGGRCARRRRRRIGDVALWFSCGTHWSISRRGSSFVCCGKLANRETGRDVKESMQRRKRVVESNEGVAIFGVDLFFFTYRLS